MFSFLGRYFPLPRLALVALTFLVAPAAPAFSQSISNVTPNQGTIGTLITIDGAGFGNKKPKALLRLGGAKIPLQVKTFRDSQITAEVTRAKLGVWDVVVQAAGATATAPGAFTVQLPANLSFDRTRVGQGELVTMTGDFLGPKRGTILLAGTGATVTSWKDTGVGPGMVTFRIPKTLAPGAYDVEVKNLLGRVSVTNALIIEEGGGVVDTIQPRVVSAGAISNTEILVQFSEQMQGGTESAENPAHYRITASLLAGQAAAESTLVVTQAQLLPLGSTTSETVKLTTLSQSDLRYTVKVVNVRDVAGNALAPAGPFVDPTIAVFQGIGSGVGCGETGCDNAPDCDGDGLSDAVEQRGWIVSITATDGTTSRREVTSEPCVVDTDGDLIDDKTEQQIGTDPRIVDTDGDALTDNQEYNQIFSNPIVQDSDNDSIDDGTEFNFFHTSPIHADTDGDQISDDTEISLANRNPRVADLPTPTVEVGDVNLRLDVRFTETTSTETRDLETKNITSTLNQSSRKETASSSSNTQEAMAKVSVGTEYKVKAAIFDGGGTFTSSINVETGWTGSWTHESSESSAQETARAYENSLTTEAETTEGATVTREVLAARMQATILIRNVSNLAYSIRNMQVTAFIQDPQNASRLIPIATLLPDSEPAEGFTLGPLQRDRGPFIFSNDTIFPSLVEELMKNPKGLIFRISNFDITDEFGRNFAFTAQEIFDRTGLVIVDNGSFDGDGDGVGDLTEYNRVATTGGRQIDTNGNGVIDPDDDRVIFDGAGKQVGITLREALSAIGLTQLDEATTPTSSLSEDEQARTYSTFINDAGVERIFRIRKAAIQDGVPKAWEIITPAGIDQTIGLDDFIVKTERDIKLAFVQDLDQDRVEARTEYANRCSDLLADTDGDTIDDRAEVLIGWIIDIAGKGTRRVYSSCALTDTDRDGLSDTEEKQLATDPTSGDTDNDGVSDFDEVRGYSITLRNGTTITVVTDPTNPDTDGDTAPDGIERLFGGNPTDPTDIDQFADSDGDGLVNVVEDVGWDVTREGVSTSPTICNIVCSSGTNTTLHVVSLRNNPDSDGDGLLDGEERSLGTNPRLADTDGDGLTDFQEVRGILVRNLGVIQTNPTDADTDNDKRSDGAEAELTDPGEPNRWIVRPVGKDPYRVFSDPLQADADFDTLADGDERTAGTDPNKGNTDGDARDDGTEVRLGTRPLVEDKSVTIGFKDFKLLEDCDDPGSQSSDFNFNLGANQPNGSFASAVMSSPGSSTSLSIRNCNSSNGNILDDDLCRRTDFPQEIQVQGGSTLNLQNRMVTIGVATNEVFSIAGFIQEEDPTTLGPGFPLELDDPFTTFEVDGTARTTTFAGNELSAGTILGTIKKANPCGLEIRLFVIVGN